MPGGSVSGGGVLRVVGEMRGRGRGFLLLVGEGDGGARASLGTPPFFTATAFSHFPFVGASCAVFGAGDA